jgi:hypothetical protein
MVARLKFGAVVAIVLGCVALFQLQQLKIRRLVAENDDFRSQISEIKSLQNTNESLAEMLKAAVSSSKTNQNELLRLRGQGARLRLLELENAQLKERRRQFDQQSQQSQASVISPEQGQVTAVTEVIKTADDPFLNKTDLGSLELQNGVPVYFDLGGGTNCIVTPTALADGNNMMEIQIGVTNAEGLFSKLHAARITARPSQHCSISVGDRMIGLDAKVKP